MCFRMGNKEELARYWIYKSMSSTSFARRIEWSAMFKWLNAREGEKILDVACGYGELSTKIAEKGLEVHGIDIWKDAIKSAKHLAKSANAPCQFVIGNAEELPYSNEYFDKVVCSSSLEHFGDDIKALREINRVLKSDGELVLTVDSFTHPAGINFKEMHRETFSVLNYYNAEILKERFEISGFKMVRSKYLLNSYATSVLFNIGIRKRWRGFLWIVTSLIAYPFCLISDKLFGEENKGYTLMAEGRKSK